MTAERLFLIGACVSVALVGLALIVGQAREPKDRTGWKGDRP